MNKLLVASAVFLGLAGAAVAQEVPAFYGQNPYAQTVDAVQGQVVSGQASATFVSPDGFNVNQTDNYSGK